MLPFRKHKKRVAAYLKIPIPKWLIVASRRLQERIANKLSLYESRLNSRQKKIAVLSFCSALFIYFSFPLVNVIVSKTNNKPRLLQHEAVTRPMNSRLDDTLNLELLKQLKNTDDHKKTDSITP